MEQDEYTISADRRRLQIGVIHEFLARSYWSPGISRDLVDAAIANSLCFGVYQGTAQVGFARVITDKASFAYLADVFVLEAHRRRGLGKRLLEAVFAWPELQGLRRFLLVTRDAHGLYRQFGFRPLAKPERMMEIVVRDEPANP